MPMPVQISLEEVITMLLSRVESLTLNGENDKTKQNIIMRVLYKKGIITDEDIIESVREEHRMLLELGAIQEMPSEEAIKSVADGMLQWAKGDTSAIKAAMDEYEKKIRELQKEEARRSNLTVASADTLDKLDRIAPPPGSQGGRGGSKLIY